MVCPECEANLDIEPGDVEEGEIVSCLECGADYEVVTSNPLELKHVEEEEDEEGGLEEEENEDGDHS